VNDGTLIDRSDATMTAGTSSIDGTVVAGVHSASVSLVGVSTGGTITIECSRDGGDQLFGR
jgi:hypothetical protein